MSNVEDKLRAAAQETRQLAQTRRPPEIVEKKATAPRGWLVFAAAFAAVVLTFGLIPWLASNTGEVPVADTTPTVPSTPTTVTTTAGTSCSATGTPAPAAQPDLPTDVAATRQAMIDAASACDLAALELLAGDPFTTSFGGGGFEEIVTREEESGDGGLGDMIRLLDMPYATIDQEDGGSIYVWPAALTYESWDDIPQTHVQELGEVHSDEELDQFARYGGYLGWRIGIRQDGSWLYYVAGE